MSNETYYIGVDVGTQSARAALVNQIGQIRKYSENPINIWNPQQDFYEQSSENIWDAVVNCIKTVVKTVQPNQIKGIGFAATCSLVILDKNGNPLAVNQNGNNNRNIILWMDHRAKKEAEEINNTKHSVLKYVGGSVSLEMQMPKLLWLKHNLPQDKWNEIGFCFDLSDFLTWKATNCEMRSTCSLVCKWNYDIANVDSDPHWNCDFLHCIGLSDLIADDFRKIGQKVVTPGTPIGQGLNSDVAKVLGLKTGCAIGAALIDAHAGSLGMLGCNKIDLETGFDNKLCLISGTSTCHLIVSSTPHFVSGVWGPYWNGLLPNMWLLEGGQSATGKLLDHIIETHPATSIIRQQLKNGDHIQEYLNRLLTTIAEDQDFKQIDLLTADLHVYPDFHGNRSPIADPTLKGTISGLTLNCDERQLAVLYLATIQALSYSTRHILGTLSASGQFCIKLILICGGLSKNPVFMQTQADVLSLPIARPEEQESVLLGAAMLGASASKKFPNLESTIDQMAGKCQVVLPNNALKDYHEKKYQVFQEMYRDQCKYRSIMRCEQILV